MWDEKGCARGGGGIPFAFASPVNSQAVNVRTSPLRPTPPASHTLFGDVYVYAAATYAVARGGGGEGRE